VVLVGEIGGVTEEDAATYAKKMTKPIVAFIAGAAAPAGKKMGHAGAIVTGNAGSYASKRQALEASGVAVVDTPSQIAAAVSAGLKASQAGEKLAASQ
jgi:succinyl-CoA synthetase alpha subunit